MHTYISFGVMTRRQECDGNADMETVEDDKSRMKMTFIMQKSTVFGNHIYKHNFFLLV